MTYEQILNDASKIYEQNDLSGLPSGLVFRGIYFYKVIIECGITDENDISKISNLFDCALGLRECKLLYVTLCEIFPKIIEKPRKDFKSVLGY